MSDEGQDRNDRAILLALARVSAGGTGVPLPPSADEELVREYVETLGLLPYGLDPATPSPEVKAKVLANVSDQGAVIEQPTAAAGPAPAHRSFDEVTFASSMDEPVGVTFQRPAEPQWPEPVASEPPRTAAAHADAASEAPPPNVLPMRQKTSWVTWAMAAAVALCVLGLGYLAGTVDQQNAAIAELQDELQGLPVQELRSIRDEIGAVKRHFRMVNVVARRAYKLESVDRVGSRAMPPEGTVYVCGRHQRWYLNVQGLEPPPRDKEYHLWFVTDEGMIDGGIVRVERDGASEMEAPSMPDGTHGFALTLEDAGISGQRPEGIMVLLAEDSVSV